MPNDWIPNPATQIERAARAYLIENAGQSLDRCFISNGNASRVTNSLTIIAAASTTAGAEYSGNELFQVRFMFRFAAIEQPGETNIENYRLELDQAVGRVKYAMNQVANNTMKPVADAISEAGRALAEYDGSDDSEILRAENNADMAEFTCLSVRYLGCTRGEPEDASGQWLEVLNYEIGVAPSNVD